MALFYFILFYFSAFLVRSIGLPIESATFQTTKSSLLSSLPKKSVFSNGVRFMVFTQSYLNSRSYIHYRFQKVPDSSLPSLYFHLFFVKVLMLSFPRSYHPSFIAALSTPFHLRALAIVDLSSNL